MKTLARELLDKYSPQRLCAVVRLLNERAAIDDGLFESNLRGRPYVSFNGLLLSESERDKLQELVTGFNGIYTKALAALVNESSETLRAMGWPAHLEYILRNEPLNRTLTPIGRYDFVQDTSGHWHLLEFNSDTPSGAQEITLVEERQWRYLKSALPGKIARLNPQIGERMASALYDEALYAPVPLNAEPDAGPRLLPRVGFLTHGRHLTDLAQVSYYARILQAKGLECVVGDIANLSLMAGQLYLVGRPIDAIYRLFQVENLSLEPIFAAYLQANMNGWLKCLNNLRGFFAQSKAVMAYIWKMRRAGLFDAAETELIEQHLPETYLLEDLPLTFDYSGYIIKEFYGREGAEVYNGATLSPEGWQQCREWRTFVAQRRINIAPVEHLVPDDDWREISLVEAFPCVGGFTMGGSWAGCYTRIGERITNSYAQFIPTLLEK
jgi:glutathionylspermidine synthase